VAKKGGGGTGGVNVNQGNDTDSKVNRRKKKRGMAERGSLKRETPLGDVGGQAPTLERDGEKNDTKILNGGYQEARYQEKGLGGGTVVGEGTFSRNLGFRLNWGP